MKRNGQGMERNGQDARRNGQDMGGCGLNGKSVANAGVSIALAGALAFSPVLAWADAGEAPTAGDPNVQGADSGAQEGSSGGQAGQSGQSAQAAEQAPSKNEVVYAKADAAGSVGGVYVVNGFDTPLPVAVNDPGSYERVANLSTTDPLSQEGGAVSLTTAAGAPFYYQGGLASSTKLPWRVSVSYRLDGADVSPEELAGERGDLEVTLTIDPATPDGTTDGDNAAAFADNFLVQAQGTFPEDKFAIEDAGDATVAHAGDNAVVTALALPGEKTTVTIKGRATDFESSGWQVAGMALSKGIDLASQDTSELTRQTGELEDAVGAARDGSGDLANGLGELSSGSGALASGLGELDGTSGSLADGWQGISGGISSLSSGASSLKAGSDAYAQGLASSAAQYQAGAAQAGAAQAAYAQAMGQAQAELQSSGTVSPATLAAIDAAAQSMAQSSGASGAYEALSGAQEGYAPLAAGIGQVDSSLGELEAGAGSFGSGLGSYTGSVGAAASAASQVSSGAALAASGSTSLSSGLTQLSGSVSGLDQRILDELQQRIDEATGAGFELRSFVAPENRNVKSVQFTYVIDGVQKPSDDAADQADDGENDKGTLVSRLVSVFTDLFK